MGWWPCGGCGGNDCTCAINVDLTISGVTDKKCATNLNTTFSGLGLRDETAVGISRPFTIDCSSRLGALANHIYAPTQEYYTVTAACGTTQVLSNFTNGAVVCVGTDGYIWVEIVCVYRNNVGRCVYQWYYKSDALASTYSLGDTVTFTYDSQYITDTSGIDPGDVNEFPFDGSTATVSVVLNGCCRACIDAPPAQMQVVIAGVANGGGCTDCAEINGTYALDPAPYSDSGTYANQCIYQYTHNFDPDPTCSGTPYRSAIITLGLTGSVTSTTITRQIFVYVNLYANDNGGGTMLGELRYRSEDAGTVWHTCQTFSAKSLTRLSNSSACDYSASTCEVTSL